MIIERLDLKAFGHFTNAVIDLSLDDRSADPEEAPPRRFHIIYGPNESGKSTSLRAITAWLFGFPHVAEDHYLHTTTQLRVGGVLSDESGQRLQCVRRRGRKATLRDAEDSDPIDESVLHEMLGGIDRETFRARFGLSHDDLVQGGRDILGGQGDLGHMLFSAGAGVSQLREIQTALDESSSTLFNPRGTRPAINAAIRELDERRQQLRQAQVAPLAFVDLRNRVAHARSESRRLNESLQQCVAELSVLRAYAQAIPLLGPWKSSLDSLARLSKAPRLDDDFTDRRRQAMSDRAVAVSQQEDLEERLRELTHRLESNPVDTAVMSQESEIQALFREISTHEKAALDQQNLRRDAKNNDRKIVELLRELSIEVDGDPATRSDAIDRALDRVRVSESSRSRIRELAAQHPRLIAQRNDASELVESTKRRLSDTVEELDSLPIPSDASLVTAAIEAVGNPQDLIEALADQRAACDALRRRCQNLLARLEGFEGTCEQAAAIHPPSQLEFDALATQLQQAEESRQACDQRLHQLQQQRGRLADDMRQAQSEEPLPTIEQLYQVRETRDRKVDDLLDLAVRGEDIADAADRLRGSIREVDRLVDTIRAHHQQVHQRESLASRVTELDSQARDAEEALAAAAIEAQNAQQQWEALWWRCGVAAGSPPRMQRWLADHEQLCESGQRLAEAEKQVEQTEQKIQRAEARLRKSIGANQESKRKVAAGALTQGGLFDDPDQDDLISLYDDAASLRARWAVQREHYDTLARRRDELAEQLPKLESRFEQLQKELEQWRHDWRRSTESFTDEGQGSSPAEALQMLDQILELDQRKRDRDIHQGRMESIDRDREAFHQRVVRAAKTASEPMDEDAIAEAVAQSLYQRLQTERSAARSRDSLREQIESARQRLAEVKTQRKVCDGVLDQLCLEAGCQRHDQLPDVERLAKERREHEASLRDLENQLTLLSGDQGIEAFIDAVGQQNAAAIQISVEQKESELAELRELVTKADQEIGALQHELDQMDGSSRAPELVQSMQLIAGQISRDAYTYATRRIASLILRRSIEHYRKENESPVLAKAEHYFATLTCGDYDRLKVDYDSKGRSTLFAVRAHPTTEVPAENLSTGTADALYLALRLASLDHQISHGKAIPLIVDDCLIQLDDRRAEAALHALSDLSLKTQVILFTHHQHVPDLAQRTLGENEVRLHQL